MFPGWFMHCLLSLPVKLYSGSILAAYLRPGLFDSAGICFHIGIPPALLLLSKFPPSQTFLYHILSSVLFFSDHVTTSASKASPVLWTCSQTGIVCIHKCAWQSVAPPGLFVIAATEIWRLTGKRLMCRPLKIPVHTVYALRMNSTYSTHADGCSEQDHTSASHTPGHALVHTHVHVLWLLQMI